jgi:predicted membrane channel-forming protein YqfA (hemolysin III family)
MKVYVAMACYAVFALLAALTLDGNARLVVWIFLGGLAVKTYLHALRKP